MPPLRGWFSPPLLPRASERVNELAGCFSADTFPSLKRRGIMPDSNSFTRSQPWVQKIGRTSHAAATDGLGKFKDDQRAVVVNRSIADKGLQVSSDSLMDLSSRSQAYTGNQR